MANYSSSDLAKDIVKKRSGGSFSGPTGRTLKPPPAPVADSDKVTSRVRAMRPFKDNSHNGRPLTTDRNAVVPKQKGSTMPLTGWPGRDSRVVNHPSLGQVPRYKRPV